jgi:phosphopantothenoylcysteine decarboxylase/phosphopantothenate--cysteine ligase
MAMDLANKKILLGICGSIAAYKAAMLVRLLIKQGAEVQVLMTEAAAKFISPLTLSTLSKHPVHTSVIHGDSWNNHVEMGLWADMMVVAPATATTLAKMRMGLCDNIVVATYLSAKCPVFFAPAMDLDMWKHPATQDNIETLQSYGNIMIPVGHGELASGLVGEGRMAEPEDIVRFLKVYTAKNADFKGKTVLITAGPTYESIDPVRFIGNKSTGKMGVEIAYAFADKGAKVHLVLGPSALEVNHPNIKLIRVQSAGDMYKEATKRYKKAHIAVMAAAVADYTPKAVSKEKIKKKSGGFKIELVRTADIAAKLGELKTDQQLNIGFALETNNEEASAKAKLKKKNFDMIVLNSLKDKGAGFAYDTNKVTIYDKYGGAHKYKLKTKKDVALDIIRHAKELMDKKNLK